ncbi:MAG TPA: hypothetical protein VFN10_23455 [Thermoanaerobaculia bacterium]|nr:hypothetical protein [Thermoanaerobaculia bacterium]
MKQAVLALAFVFAAACAGGGGSSSGPATVPGQGAITISINPNPIHAVNVSGTTYDFPFDVIVRETGGRPVEITRVSAEVIGPLGVSLATESYDAARITQLGFSTHVPANSELRYHFAPRKAVPDDRLFGSVSADLRVEAHDDNGAPATASTNVTISR